MATENSNILAQSAEPKAGMLPPEETSVLGSDDKETGKIEVNANSDAEYVTGFKLALVVGSVALACFLMLLDTMVISTVTLPKSNSPSSLDCSQSDLNQAIPRITDTFNSLPDVGWYASAYQFGRSVIYRNLFGNDSAKTTDSAAPQPLTGKVYTHFNSKVRITIPMSCYVVDDSILLD
ncbi:hypothetical protein SLS64_006547 [Diaporthe eres]